MDAARIEELIAKSPRPDEVLAIDEFTTAVAPALQRRLLGGPSITMIGYGELVRQTMSSAGVRPVGDCGGAAAAPDQQVRRRRAGRGCRW